MWLQWLSLWFHLLQEPHPCPSQSGAYLMAPEGSHTLKWSLSLLYLPCPSS